MISCSNEEDKGQIESLKVIQHCTLGEYFFGNERMYVLESIVSDKSASDRYHQRINELLSLMKQIDSLSYPLVSEMNLIRLNVVKQESSKVINEAKPNFPVFIDYDSDINFSSNGLPSDEDITRIIEEIESYRNELCTVIIESYQGLVDGVSPVFVAPKKVKFKNDIDKSKLITSALKKSRISIEDQNVVLEVMTLLTKQDDDWRVMITSDQNWIDISMSLLSIQNILLRSRSIAMSWVASKRGCNADYNFTNFSPIVIGTSNAFPNDTVQIQVFSGAYNAYVNPQVNIFEGGTLIKTQDGKGFIQTVIPETGEIEIRGEIIYINKSGKARATNWSHKIQVLEENKDI